MKVGRPRRNRPARLFLRGENGKNTNQRGAGRQMQQMRWWRIAMYSQRPGHPWFFARLRLMQKCKNPQAAISNSHHRRIVPVSSRSRLFGKLVARRFPLAGRTHARPGGSYFRPRANNSSSVDALLAHPHCRPSRRLILRSVMPKNSRRFLSQVTGP